MQHMATSITVVYRAGYGLMQNIIMLLNWHFPQDPQCWDTNLRQIWEGHYRSFSILGPTTTSHVKNVLNIYRQAVIQVSISSMWCFLQHLAGQVSEWTRCPVRPHIPRTVTHCSHVALLETVVMSPPTSPLLFCIFNLNLRRYFTQYHNKPL